MGSRIKYQGKFLAVLHFQIGGKYILATGGVDSLRSLLSLQPSDELSIDGMKKENLVSEMK